MFFFIIMVITIGTSTGAKILVMMPNPAPSFTRSFQPLFRELAERGHEVTSYTVFPLPPPIPASYKEVLVENVFISSPRLGNYLKDIKDYSNSSLTNYALFLWELGLMLSEEVLKTPAIQELIKSDESYDLIIDNSIIYFEPIAGFRHKFNCPSINLFPNSPNQIFSEITGNPLPYAYIPYHNLPYNSNMSFWQRATNTYIGLLTDLGNRLYYLPRQDVIMRNYFNNLNMPHITSLLASAHVSLLDTHLLLDYPRPYLTGTVLVGGMLTPKTNSLPQELKQWLDKADEGFIYFSLGSVMRFGTLSSSQRSAILDTFGKLKLPVLLKWEGDNKDELPTNVRAETWVSQADILAHRNCHLFVTHGGLHSLLESLHYGVPVVGLPIFGDQLHNLVNLQERGVATYLPLDQLQMSTFTTAILLMLNNEKAKENAKRLSVIVQDHPMAPLQTAVYWVEYVLHHKGAHHLRSAVTDLYWYQLYLLDIILFVLVLIVVIFMVVKYTLKLMFNLIAFKRKVD
ncbi:UDP-glycosyltransferase UGT5-like [Homalodisca vitripennis]|uniref:UDP-glycosyltransferase UGT5-like n=1 Tax=Homalodisca vitripennis TaxID=197043 RepID=UPI001EEB5073|nr:UDP-glycosyltransferase UGT5-like [Homalodisca vitripennis]XP_046672881.1 UDP-glycosyltransferase UGT5-like [Homalodisca vitripennis]